MRKLIHNLILIIILSLQSLTVNCDNIIYSVTGKPEKKMMLLK